MPSLDIPLTPPLCIRMQKRSFNVLYATWVTVVAFYHQHLNDIVNVYAVVSETSEMLLLSKQTWILIMDLFSSHKYVRA